MPVVTGEEGTPFVIVPEGMFVNAKVVSIEENEFVYGEKTINNLKWKFEITESGPFEGYFVWDQTSPKFTIDPASKLYEWATAILGRTFDIGEQFDTDHLINQKCKIMVGHKKPDADGKVWMKVDEVMGRTGPNADTVFG